MPFHTMVRRQHVLKEDRHRATGLAGFFKTCLHIVPDIWHIEPENVPNWLHLAIGDTSSCVPPDSCQLRIIHKHRCLRTPVQ